MVVVYVEGGETVREVFNPIDPWADRIVRNQDRLPEVVMGD